MILLNKKDASCLIIILMAMLKWIIIEKYVIDADFVAQATELKNIRH